MQIFKYILLIQLLANGILQGSAIASEEVVISVHKLQATIEESNLRGRKITYTEGFVDQYNDLIKSSAQVHYDSFIEGVSDQEINRRYLFAPWISTYEQNLLQEFASKKVSVGEIEVDGVKIKPYISKQREDFMHL